MNKVTFLSVVLVILGMLFGCEPLVTKFPDEQPANRYESIVKSDVPSDVGSIMVMAWNIRFGAAQIPWFGDSCGDRVILTRQEVLNNLQAIADKINQIQPDILLMQEVDVESKRSAYVDQVQWLLDNTYLNYGAFASMWEAQYVPSDGLGRLNTGNAVLSRWNISETTRIPLALRGDQDALTRYFYLRRNILKVKTDVPNTNGLYVLDVHTAAFSTDDTKKKHLETFKREIDRVADAGMPFVAGGDLNGLPPGSDSTNYCDESRCLDDPPDFCPDGADYSPEVDWLVPLYTSYAFAVPLDEYALNNPLYFTQAHGTAPNKKLDYLLTRSEGWVSGSSVTHQDAIPLSDHVPVTARLIVSP